MWLNHVHIWVRDLDRAVTFYRDALGLDATVIPAANMASVRVGPNFSLDLDHRPEQLGDEAKPIILGFMVESADDTFTKLKSKGLLLEQEPADQYWGLRNFHFRDPDGYTIECAQPLPATPSGAPG